MAAPRICCTADGIGTPRCILPLLGAVRRAARRLPPQGSARRPGARGGGSRDPLRLGPLAFTANADAARNRPSLACMISAPPRLFCLFLRAGPPTLYKELGIHRRGPWRKRSNPLLLTLRGAARQRVPATSIDLKGRPAGPPFFRFGSITVHSYSAGVQLRAIRLNLGGPSFDLLDNMLDHLFMLSLWLCLPARYTMPDPAPPPVKPRSFIPAPRPARSLTQPMIDRGSLAFRYLPAALPSVATVLITSKALGARRRCRK